MKRGYYLITFKRGEEIKDSWNREEFTKLIKEAMIIGANIKDKNLINHVVVTNFIEQNL